MRRFLLLSLFALFSLSCGNTSRPDYVVHLVEHGGLNPFMGCLNGTIRVDVAQGTDQVLTQNGTITNDAVGDLAVQIPSYGLVTQIQVTALCTTGMVPKFIGSTPEFIPTGYGFVDIVLAAPNTCVQLSTPTLVPTRIAPQLVTLGANVLVVGGSIDQAGSPTTALQGLDPIELTYPSSPANLDPFPTAVGFGASVPLSTTSFAFFSTISGVYDATPGVAAADRVSTPFSLPASAGPDSAVVALVDGSIAVVGGSNGLDGAHDITWIAADGLSSTSGLLTYARRRPAAVVVGNKLLVVGGQAANEPLFELVAIRGTDPGTPFGPPGIPMGEARYAPLVTTDSAHVAAFVALGSTDPEDESTISATSWVLSNCRTNEGCTVVNGPTWPDAPRARFRTIEHQVGSDLGALDYETLVIDGIDEAGVVSPSVDRVHFDTATGFSVTAAGILATPRSQVGAAEIGGGIVMVAGGADASGNPLGTVELCYPRNLAPITSN